MAVFNTGSKMISKYNLQRKKLSGRLLIIRIRKILFDMLTKLDLTHIICHIKYFRYKVKTMETTYEKQAKVFKAFCDEKRLGILDYSEAVKNVPVF